MIEIEVQNETHQTQERMRFAAVPRIGEGLRLREPDGMWASYDVLDVWYQKAEYGDFWIPYLHVCMTPEEVDEPEPELEAPHFAEHQFDMREPVAAPIAAPVAPPVEAPVEAHVETAEAVIAEPSVHEDDAHDLSGEDQFATLGGEAKPFKI